MSIQANINQGITTLSLLLSQSPAAEGQRTQKRIETEQKILRETRPEVVKTAQEAAAAEETEKTKGAEERAQKADERAQREKELKIAEATGLYKGKKEMIVPIEDLMKPGVRSIDIRAAESTRRSAAKTARELWDIDPKPDYQYEAATWTSQAEELRRKAEGMEKTAAQRAEREAKNKKKTKLVVAGLEGGAQ